MSSRSDCDGAVFSDVDFSTGFSSNRTNGFATFTNHITDFVLVDFHGEQAWCVCRQLLRACNGGFHLFQDVQTSIFGLCQSNLHDFFGNTLDFDVHLQRGYAFGRTGNFKVHIAQVILITQDVGQHGEFVVVQNQTHCDTGNVCFQRHTGRQQAQTAAADGSHRRRTVGLGNLGNNTHGVAEFFRGRQYGNQCAFCQAAMSDFAAFRRADATHFAGRIRREVVMQHKAVGVFAGECVNNLLVARSTQSRYGKGLGFATGKQSRTMCTRQYAGLDVQRTDGAGIATVDTRLTFQNLGADNVGFQMFENTLDFVGSQSIGFFGNQRIFYCIPSLVQFSGTRLFLTDFERFFNCFACDFAHFGNQFFIGFRCFPIPYFRIYFIGELVDGVNRYLHLVVAVNYGTQHHVFRQDFSFGFHHQNGFGCTRNHQVQLRFSQFGFGRVQYVHTVYITYACGTNRTGKRYAAQHQRSGCAEHGRNVGINFRVNGNYHRNDLDVVVETFWEQRADRTVDQTAG